MIMESSSNAMMITVLVTVIEPVGPPAARDEPWHWQSRKG
jgi:hypothetical protein